MQLESGGFGVKKDGKTLPELPCKPYELTFSAWSDQGSTGMAGLNFLMHSLGYFIITFFDMNHRLWNDLKGAFKKTKEFNWRCIAFFTLVFNINYNPFGKGAWFEAKKEKWDEWCCTASAKDPLLRKYGAQIAEDLSWSTAPETDDDYRALIKEIKSMQSFNKAGPSTKMMRWFSWFEAYHKVFSKELWAVKMMLEIYMRGDEGYLGDDIGDAADDDGDCADKADPNAQVRDMKKRLGTFKTAHKVITPEITWTAKLLDACVQPIWFLNSQRVTNVRTPSQVLQHEIDMNAGKWAEEAEVLLNHTLRSRKTCFFLGLYETGAESRVEMLFDQVSSGFKAGRSVAILAQASLPQVAVAVCNATATSHPSGRASIPEKQDGYPRQED